MPMSEAEESTATRWRQEAERGAAVAVATRDEAPDPHALEGGS
jgi:hypothetical protein